MKSVMTMISLVIFMSSSAFAALCAFQVKKSRGFIEHNGFYNHLPYIDKGMQKPSDYLKAGPNAEFIPVISRVGIDQYAVEILAKKVNHFIKTEIQCKQESLWTNGKYEGETAKCEIDSTRYLDIICIDFQ